MRVVEPLLKRADLVIPLAALVGAPLCARDQIGATSLNRDAVLDLAKRVSRDQMVVYPTTNSGYGVGYVTEMCTEQSPLNPVSLYGRSKVAAEEIGPRIRGVSLRLASVFGMSPRMRLDLMVNEFVWRAVQDRSVVLFEATSAETSCTSATWFLPSCTRSTITTRCAARRSTAD